MAHELLDNSWGEPFAEQFADLVEPTLFTDPDRRTLAALFASTRGLSCNRSSKAVTW